MSHGPSTTGDAYIGFSGILFLALSEQPSAMGITGTLGKSQTLLIDKSTWITWLKSRQVEKPQVSSCWNLNEIPCGVRPKAKCRKANSFSVANLAFVWLGCCIRHDGKHKEVGPCLMFINWMLYNWVASFEFPRYVSWERYAGWCQHIHGTQ